MPRQISRAGKILTAAGRAQVWDVPTRLVHWLIAALVPFSWWSATHDHLTWHRGSGYVILGLVVFRLIWGAVGSSTARFAEFLKSPAQVAAYLRQSGKMRLGHNPLGGWSVAALLITLATQVGLGLFSVDEDGLEAGPLSRFISFDAGRAVAHVHHLTFWALVCFIALHLMAVGFHEARGRRLTRAMVTGDTPAIFALPTLRLAPARTAIAAAIAAAAFAWFVARGLRI